MFLQGIYYVAKSKEYNAVCFRKSGDHYDICSVIFKNGCDYIAPIDRGNTLSEVRKLMNDYVLRI